MRDEDIVGYWQWWNLQTFITCNFFPYRVCVFIMCPTIRSW